MARLSDSITYGNHAITGDVNVGGTLTVDGDVYLGGTVDGRNVSSDGSKLDNIESNATADQTKADIDALNIDADTLDGINSTQFVRSDTGKIPEDRLPATITNQTRFSNSTTYFGGTDGNTAEIWMQTGGAGSPQIGLTDNNGDMAWAIGGDDTGNSFKIHGNASGSIPTIDNVSNPFFEISTSGVISGNGSGLTGTASLRATGTTKADVGLSLVRNVGSYSQAESNGRYLAKSGKAADSNKLDGINSTQFLRSDSDDTVSGLLTFTHANPQDMKRGISGGYDDGNGSGSNWGVNIWGMGDAYAGTGAGTSFSTGGYQLAWLRSSHSSANAAIGEGLYLYSQNAYRGGFGDNGADFPYGITTTDIVASGNITANSDRRLKKDLLLIPAAIEKVSQLSGYTYTSIKNGSRNTGVVAQEVQEVLPEAVEEGKDGTLSVAYGNMVGLLIEAVKEQQTQIDELKRRIG